MSFSTTENLATALLKQLKEVGAHGLAADINSGRLTINFIIVGGTPKNLGITPEEPLQEPELKNRNLAFMKGAESLAQRDEFKKRKLAHNEHLIERIYARSDALGAGGQKPFISLEVSHKTSEKEMKMLTKKLVSFYESISAPIVVATPTCHPDRIRAHRLRQLSPRR